MSHVVVRDLRFGYPGGFSLSVADWSVAKGGRAAVLGPSGCGKSTLLRLLSGEMVPDAGTVRVGDLDVGAASEATRRAWRIRHVGFVFQDYPLVGYLDAVENVVLPFRLHPALALDGSVRRRAEALLDELGLGDKHRRRPSALSQGERQRVAIARALVTEPDILLADEPTTGLDDRSADAVLRLLDDAVAARGATLVMVTHDRRVRDRFADVLELGAP